MNAILPIQTTAAAGAVALNLHGDVGFDITVQGVAAALKAAAGKPLNISIHSYGGEAMAGIAIHNMLARYQGRKTVVIEGIAASAASLIAMAGDEIIMPENAFMLIHDASGVAIGKAEAARELADTLDTISAAYRRTYAAKSGKSEDEIAALMDADRWLSAKEALDAGLVTAIGPAADVQMDGRRLAVITNLPDALKVSADPNNLPPDADFLAHLAAVAARHGIPLSEIHAMTTTAPTRAQLAEAVTDAIAAQFPAGFATYAAPRAAADARADKLTAMIDGLFSRATNRAPTAQAREFRGMSMVDLARECLASAGVRTGRSLSPADAIQMAMTSGDFPNLLQGTGQRALQERMAVAPGAARQICAMRETPDFREGTFTQAAGLLNLAELPEGGGIEHAAPAERAETYQVKTYARNAGWTRQALVNDDLAFIDSMNLFANAVVATEATAFAAMFATNGAGWGPTLNDALPLFHATHGNVASGAVGTTGISAGRVVMRAQTDARGNLIAPEPRIMLVGPAGETAAEQALVQITTVATTEANRPVFAGKLTHAVEPRLSGNPWFMFADPAVAPVLAMVTLQGNGGVPRITQHESASYDGVLFKITHDFCIAPMSFVGAVRMTGS